MTDFDFLESLESLIFQIEMNETEITRTAQLTKKQKGSKKSESGTNMLQITHAKFPLPRQSYGFPLGGGDRYATRFTLAVNFNSTLHMMQTLHEVINPTETRVIKRLYGKTDSSTGKAKNHFGTYTTMEFADIHQFYEYNDQFAALVPDGMMHMHNISTFTNPKKGNTIISVNFTYTGTMLQQHADIQVHSSVQHDSGNSSTPSPSPRRNASRKRDVIELDDEPLPEEVGLLDLDAVDVPVPADDALLELDEFDFVDNLLLSNASDPAVEMMPTPTVVTTSHPIEASGSYTLYINEQSKIYCVEFFYAFR